MGRIALVVVAALVLVGSGVVGAHHSYAEFDVDRTVSVEGVIDNVVFANPHVVLTVRTRDAAVYTATWRAAFQLDRQGVSRTQLQVGDVVVVSGNPSRNPAEHHLSRLSEVRRPRDGWAWAEPRRPR